MLSAREGLNALTHITPEFPMVCPFSMALITSNGAPCDMLHHWYQRIPDFASHGINSLRPRRNRRHFADDTFKRIFLNENVSISVEISLKFVPKGPVNNIPTLVQIMAWRRPGNRPLSEPTIVRLPMHICVTQPQ